MQAFLKLFSAVIVLSCCLEVFVHGYRHPQRSAGRHLYTTSIARRSALPMVALPTNLPVTLPAKLSEIVSKLRFDAKVMNISALTALVVAFRNKISAKLQSGASNVMEQGWTKRGDGTATQRTLEVWSFAFSFAFKWVSRHDTHTSLINHGQITFPNILSLLFNGTLSSPSVRNTKVQEDGSGKVCRNAAGAGHHPQR